MNEKTKKFDRLPNPSGVVFEGFENIVIKSRNLVKKQFEDYLKVINTARKPTMRIIEGEWGEGKTDAYERYIKPSEEKNNFVAPFVSASTIKNCFEKPLSDKKSSKIKLFTLMDTAIRPSEKFLIALFASIRDETRELNLPDPNDCSNSNEFIDNCIRSVCKDKKQVIVFIDEFEELLNASEILKKVLSGLKETINGQYKPISENGEFEGQLHFIIATTPDALYRIETGKEYSEIYGGWRRRTEIITLPLVKKIEGIPFLWDLIKYSYRDVLPHPLPIRNIGVLNGIYKIAQGNPGNMVSKVAGLLNKAIISDTQISVIDNYSFLDFFRTQTISVYGSSTYCVDEESFNRIISNIRDQQSSKDGEKCNEIISLLIGEYKPFISSEIEKRLDIKDVNKYIELINEKSNLDNLGIHKALIQVGVVQKQNKIQNILEKFSDFIIEENGLKIIKIGNYSDSLDDFKDKITYHDIEKGELLERFYLPTSEKSITSFFEGISEDRVVEIKNKIKTVTEPDTVFYLASDDLLANVFPIPIPKELSFIKNKEDRFRAFREITKKLKDINRDDFTDAFLTVVNFSDIRFEPLDSLKKSRVFLWMDRIKINSLIFAINGDVKKNHIDDIQNLLKNSISPIHLCLVLYTDVLTEKAEEKINDNELGKLGDNILISLKISPNLLKKIMIISNSINDDTFRGAIDEEIRRNESRKIVYEDLELERKIKDWLDEQRSRGMYIDEFILEKSKQPLDLFGALKFFINFLEAAHTPEEIFTKNFDTIHKPFMKYNARTKIIPDIALPQLINNSKDLENNHFLKSNNGKYEVISHPVEERILRILNQQKGKISIESLTDHFILSSNKNVVQNIFVEILEHKGKIQKKDRDKLIELTNPSEFYDSLENDYSQFEQIFESDIKSYGFCFISKQRQEKLVSLIGFEQFLTNNKRELENFQKDVKLQKIFLLHELLNDFTRYWIENIKKSYTLGKGIVNEMESIRNGCVKSAEVVQTNFSRWLKISIDNENIKECKEILDLTGKINIIHNTTSCDDLKSDFKIFYNRTHPTIDSTLGKIEFNYDWDDKIPYFNVKLFIIKCLMDEKRQLTNSTIKNLNDLNSEFKQISEGFDIPLKTIKSKKIDPQMKLCASIHTTISSMLNIISPKYRDQKLQNQSISDLQKILQGYLKPISENRIAISSLDIYLSNLLEEEKIFVTKKKELEEFIKLLNEQKEIFDNADIIVEKSHFFKKILDDYESQSSEISSLSNNSYTDFYNSLNNQKNLSTFIKSNVTEIEAINTELINSIDDYKIRNISKLERMSLLLDVVSKNPEIVEFMKSKKKITGSISNIQTIPVENLLNVVLKDQEMKVFLQVKEKIKHVISDIQSIQRINETSFLKKLHETIISCNSEFLDLIKRVLTENEISILDLLIELSKQNNVIWYDDIHKQPGLTIDSSEIDKILHKFVSDGYLKIGYNLI
jgi:hypothetical protein